MTVAACILRPIYVDLEYIFGLIFSLVSSPRALSSLRAAGRCRMCRTQTQTLPLASGVCRLGLSVRRPSRSLPVLVTPQSTLVSLVHLGSLLRWETLLLNVLLHAPSTINSMQPSMDPPCNGRPGAPPLYSTRVTPSRLMRGPLVRSLRRRTRAAAAPVAHVAVQVLLDLRGEAV